LHCSISNLLQLSFILDLLLTVITFKRKAFNAVDVRMGSNVETVSGIQRVKMQKLHFIKMLQLDTSSYWKVTNAGYMHRMGTCLRGAGKVTRKKDEAPQSLS